ncbi:MAG: xylS, partial [Paenibacillus sp.]|nr:xylS [Paenibacillus sp.]
YAKLRYRLLPYIYSAAHVAARTAMPIIRAMPLAYPDDPQSDGLTQQYMLGDYLLVAAFTNDVHLPEGVWIDYWSGERFVGPADMKANVPDNRGGPLFVKAGAIIPVWPEMDYVGQKPLDTIGLHIYPHGKSEFALYEDDGTTCRYVDGGLAVTSISSENSANEIRIRIGVREGRYEGMPERRSYEISIHAEGEPFEVTANGERLQPNEQWRYADGTITLKVDEDAAGARPLDICCISAK